MADKKISDLTSGAPAQAADEYVVARSGANYKLTLTNIAASMPPIGATTPNTGAFTTLSSSAGANFATSSGSVGVGRSPSTKLDVEGQVRGLTRYYLQRPSDNYSLSIASRWDGSTGSPLTGTAGVNMVFGNEEATGNVIFATENVQRARIAANGQFLIGTTSTVSEEVLSAAGSSAGWRIGSNRTAILGSGNAAGGFNYSGGNASSATAGVIYSRVEAVVSSATASSESGALALFTRNSGTLAERARVTAGGQLIVNGTSASDGKIAAFKYNNVDDGAAIYGYQGNAAYPGVGTTRYGVRGECIGYSSVANVGVYGYSVDNAVSNTKLYGVWGETGEVIYNTGYGVYGKSVLYTGSSGSVFGVYGTVSTTQSDTTVGTTTAGYFYNASTKGLTAYGVAIETVAGAGTVIPFRIVHAAAELLRVNSGGELLIGTTDNGAYLLQVNSQIWATNATIATSDSRLKENVTPIANALDTIKKVRAVTFDFKQDTKYNLDKERQTGFIAQELKDALDNDDYKNCVVKECGDYYGVAYEKMIPVLVAAIQEQQAMIKSLEAKVAALESK